MDSELRLKLDHRTSLYYRLWRTNKPKPLLVLLHGMASNCTRWSEFVEYTTLKDRFDILRPDLRGHGKSFTRRCIGMDIWSDDLKALLDTQGYANAVVVGHSLGANVALWFAQRYPQRAMALGLIDPTFTEALHGTALWLRRLSPLLRAAIAGARLLNCLGVRRREIPHRDLRQLDEDVRARLLGTGKMEDFVKRYTSPLADLKHFPTANYLQEVIEIMRPIPHLHELRVPMLALISQAVTFTDTEKTRAALTRYPQSEIIPLTAYHWPLTEKPVEVRGAIEAWCSRLLGAA